MPSKKLLSKNDEVNIAWKKFTKSNELDRKALRDVIADSWVDSLSGGVDPLSTNVEYELTESELKNRVKNISHIYAIAKPFMKTLYNTVEDVGMLVRLTDMDGYVLECFGDRTTLDLYKKMHFYRGSNVSEDVVGTNAIGLTVKHGKPFLVLGSEHYRKVFHNWTTSSAPIKNDKGETIAVISMSGKSAMVHPHTLGLIMASAQAIEHELSLAEVNKQLSKTNEHYLAIMESISEGIIVVDEDSTIKDVNHLAREFLGETGYDIIGRQISKFLSKEKTKKFMDVMNNRMKYEEEEVFLRNNKGKKISVVVNATPIKPYGNEKKEIVVTFRESKKIHSLVNKIVGSNAIFTFDDILGNSIEKNEAVKLSKMVANTDATVLLHGESGTGKEMFAQGIHNGSDRKNKPFVFINCGAIPRDLVASELFGYVDGAFTGARKGGHPGKFELADGGTLFLDEIGDMPLDTQATLLRVLETKQVVRVGGHTVSNVDVRVIAASHKNLKEEVEKGNFRSDLFYRLNVLPIHTPALRERRNDIPILVDFFYKQFKSDYKDTKIEQSFYEAMMKYDWPGNVRELQNVMQMVTNLVDSDTLLNADVIPDYIKTDKKEHEKNIGSSEYKVRTLDEIEKEAIENALYINKGNIQKTSKELGLGRSTLYRKMEKYDISV